jgi:hypothetical protein
MDYRYLASAFLITFVGWLHFIGVAWVWGYLVSSPEADWLMLEFSTNNFHQINMFLHDFLINLVLAIPLAVLIFFLKPKNPFLFLCLALLPSFVIYVVVPLGTHFFTVSTITGWATNLLSVPIVLVVLYRAFGNEQT